MKHFCTSHSLGELLLNEEEKDYGSVIIDIGAGLTTVSYFERWNTTVVTINRTSR